MTSFSLLCIIIFVNCDQFKRGLLMKKYVNFAKWFFAGALTLGILTPAFMKGVKNIEPDNIDYEEVKLLDLDDFTPVYADEDEVVTADKVIIHYHNDDAGNKDRRFYVWNTLAKGIEYDDPSICTWSSDGKDMSITLDFLHDSRFSTYAGLGGMSFIVKTKDVWIGQSSDTYLDYSLFPPVNGLVEVWTIPGEGNNIDIYQTEEETKMDKIINASFKDWKTITVTSTIAPSSYQVYAFTANYFKLAAESQPGAKPKYLFKSGSNPNTQAVAGTEYVSFDIPLNNIIHINVQYVVEAIFPTNTAKKMSKIITFDNLYETERFNIYYTYEGTDLGSHIEVDEDLNETTVFKVWSPTAARMRLLLYTNGTPKLYGGSDDYFASDMTYQPGGIWTATLKGSFDGTYYTYFVYNTAGNFEVVDPYAKACGVNGIRGMVCDFANTNPEHWDNLPLKWDGDETGYDIESANELSVYEVHIRDLTQDESWTGESKNGTYSAFAEAGTSYQGLTTGFDHIEEMGVTAVQILPFFDHDDAEVKYDNEKGEVVMEDEVNIDFNWGYNPLNYNCLEGGYATDPFNGEARVKEFKQLVLNYANNANHTRIIMDVVYNHVSSAPASNFHKLMPKYYFRYTKDGSYYNGSGCGNEVKTEAPMMRKFIVESLCWWASEYKIKGFRFDLMGLIDCETLRQAATELYKIDPDIVMYGEGWRGDGDGFHGKGDPAETGNAYSKLYGTNSRVSVGAFNDAGRNALRGGNDAGWGSSSALPGYGYMSQGASDISAETRTKVADMLWGIHTGKGGNPSQTVNYASCHDNWTLFDQLYYCLGDNGTKPSIKRVAEASTAANAFVMLTNGIAFIQGGEEIFRSKELDSAAREEVTSDTYENMYGHYCSHNSYNAPDYVNSFKWGNKKQISRDGETVQTTSYCNSLAQAIKLHTTMPKFAYKDNNFPYSHTSAGNKIDNTSWAGKDKNNATYNGCAGFQLDEYFIFFAGRNWGYVGFGDVPKCGDPLFSFNLDTYDTTNKTVNVGNFANNTGGGIVLWYRGA